MYRLYHCEINNFDGMEKVIIGENDNFVELSKLQFELEEKYPSEDYFIEKVE